MKIFFEKKRIMYILFFILFSIQSLAYSDEINLNYVQLGKYQSETLKIGYNYFYLDLSEFKNEDYLYFKVSLEYGYFRGEYMKFGIFSEIPNTPSVSQKVHFCSEEKGELYDENYYISYKYNFRIPKPKDNYIIVSSPGTMSLTILGGSVTIQSSELECAGIISENYYLDGDTGMYYECYNTCKKCSSPGNEANHNCDECKTGYIFLNEPLINKKNCLINCNYYYYFNENGEYICTTTDSCPTNYKLISPKRKCINECKEDNDNKYIFEYNNSCLEECPSELKTDKEDKKCLELCPSNKFEYNNTCLTNCPSDTYKIYIDRNICSETIQENYYLDGETGIYNKCYDSCKKCSGHGDLINNNCEECINGYIFLNDPLIKEKNCVIKCNYNYYFNENNEYTCTITDSCPQNYKLIAPRKKCINECMNDFENKYIYDYNNICVEECPLNLKIDKEEKKCLESCYEDKFEYNDTCLTNCPNGTYKIYNDRNIVDH